ncbi:MAG: sodium:proton antiporter NhaD [Chitinophagia bacterium]|jgi:Na+/H+ antiporter NhaD/arsenite permease-like protein
MLLTLFIIGYLAIAFEHQIKLNKAASALITGVLCWTIYMLSGTDHDKVYHELLEHMGEISGILFFLLGAMTIVELIDAHDGFDLISSNIKTKKKSSILVIITILSFFLSAILDNLTTTIVLISLVAKLIHDDKEKLIFASMIVISANAGGAWSPIGDVTTTMLWIGGQISALTTIKEVFLPGLVSVIIPLVALAYGMKGEVISTADTSMNLSDTGKKEKNLVFFVGMISLLFVPVFKTLTGLPPFMGILFSLGCMWLITEIIHSGKDNIDKDNLSVNFAIRKIDTPSILFFLGILLSVAALQSAGILKEVAQYLTETIGNQKAIVITLGILSAIIDNVPLVAATQGMYSLADFPMDHPFWQFIAYCTGTGGSILIIGSAAGVAAMGLTKIEFFWYLRKISLWALLGYLSGAMVFVLMNWR